MNYLKIICSFFLLFILSIATYGQENNEEVKESFTKAYYFDVLSFSKQNICFTYESRSSYTPTKALLMSVLANTSPLLNSPIYYRLDVRRFQYGLGFKNYFNPNANSSAFLQFQLITGISASKIEFTKNQQMAKPEYLFFGIQPEVGYLFTNKEGLYLSVNAGVSVAVNEFFLLPHLGLDIGFSRNR